MTPLGLVVEFLGLPGVGKTTLALEVAKLLPDLPVRSAYGHLSGRNWVARRLSNARDIARLALEHPRYVAQTVRVIRASGQRTPYDGLKVTNNWLNVSALTLASRRAPGITLFDQGTFQALWSVGYSAEEEARPACLTRLGALMPKPNLLVLVAADLTTVQRRLRARGGRESRLATRAEATQLREVAALLDTVVVAARVEKVALLEVDGDADDALAANARAVADAVRIAARQAPRPVLTGQGDPAI
jgi:broad-specificity NMP kinase